MIISLFSPKDFETYCHSPIKILICLFPKSRLNRFDIVKPIFLSCLWPTLFKLGSRNHYYLIYITLLAQATHFTQTKLLVQSMNATYILPTSPLATSLEWRTIPQANADGKGRKDDNLGTCVQTRLLCG